MPRARKPSNAQPTPAAPAACGTRPLAGKLGIRDGTQVVTFDAPPDLAAWLGPLPRGAAIVAPPPGAPLTFVHAFVTRRSDLAQRLADLRRRLDPAGTLWVSWPKRSSGVATDVTEDAIRDAALPLGFVDVKVCAVSAVWSGLKLVVRRSERAPRPPGVKARRART